MMRQMRQNTKWIMLITAAAFVALMVFEWGMDASGGAFGMRDVGRVDGTPVSVEQWQATYRSVYDQVQQSQDQAITSQQNREIEDMAWEELVNQILIQKELERRGIGVSDEEIRDAARYSPPPELRNDPAFQSNGQFDLERYHEFLSAASTDRFFLQQLEQYYREVIPRSKLMRQLTAGVYVPDSRLWREWEEQNERVRVRFAALNPRERISDADVEVTDAEVEAYYEENREEFAVPARARVEYVTLSKTPTAADSAAARERAESLYQELLDGADFAELAQVESGDLSTAGEGGDMGTLVEGQGQVAYALEDAIFTVPVGEPTEPIRTDEGYHILLVRDRDEEGGSAEVSQILVRLERTDESEFRLLSRADSLESLGEDRTIREAARELGLETREAEFTEDFPILPGAGQAEEGAHWVFEEMVAPGAVSPVFESADAFYMMELTSYSPAGYQSLEAAAPTIRDRLRVQKKVERAQEEAREYAEALRNGTLTFDELLEEPGIRVEETEPFTRTDFVAGLGQQNRVIGTAFGLSEGQISHPVTTQDNVFLLEALERVPADREEWEMQRDIQRAVMVEQIRQERLDQWLTGLRANVRIDDRRQEVFEAQEEMEDGPQMPMVF